MRLVPTYLVHFNVCVIQDLLEMGLLVMISTNAPLEVIIAVQMQHAQTLRDHSCVLATPDSVGMVSLVLTSMNV